MKRKLFGNLRSLRSKMIVVCVLLLAVPSLIVGILGYQLSKNQLEKAGQIQLNNEAQRVVDTILIMNTEVEQGKITLEDAQEYVKQWMLGPKDDNGQRPISKEVNLGEKGYSFILNEKGDEIAHPLLEGTNIMDMKNNRDELVVDLDSGMSLVPALVEKAKSGGGFTYFEWPIPSDPNVYEKKITYSIQDPVWGWIICSGSYLSDFNKGADQVLYMLLYTLGGSFIVGLIIVSIFSRSITKPIRQIASQANSIAAGDLSIPPLAINKRDETGQLARDFNTMVSQLRELIMEVGQHVSQVAVSSEQLTISAEQTSKATEQITMIVDDVAQGAADQMKNTGKTFDLVNNMSNSMDEITEHMEQVSHQAVTASDNAANGSQSIQDTVNQMNSIHESVQGLAQVIKSLRERSVEISETSRIISSIAQQTNLLALNASIEAARAGEHGKGFSVVAAEVRKLAEDSSSSAQQITQTMDTIQQETAAALESMEQTVEQVTSGLNIVHTAGQSFTEINQSVVDVASQVQEVSAGIQEMHIHMKQIMDSMGEVVRISDEAAAGTETAAAATEEQHATMEEISASSSELANMAEKLQSIISQFKV